MSNIHYLTFPRPPLIKRTATIEAWQTAASKMDELSNQWTALEAIADELAREANRRIDKGLPYTNTPLAYRLDQLNDHIEELVNQSQAIHAAFEAEYGDVVELMLNHTL